MSSSHYIPLILLLWKHSQHDVRAGGHVTTRTTPCCTEWSDRGAHSPRARDGGLGNGARPHSGARGAQDEEPAAPRVLQAQRDSGTQCMLTA